MKNQDISKSKFIKFFDEVDRHMNSDLRQVTLTYKSGLKVACAKKDGFSSIYEVASAFETASKQFVPVRIEHNQFLFNKLEKLREEQKKKD